MEEQRKSLEFNRHVEENRIRRGRGTRKRRGGTEGPKDLGRWVIKLCVLFLVSECVSVWASHHLLMWVKREMLKRDEMDREVGGGGGAWAGRVFGLGGGWGKGARMGNNMDVEKERRRKEEGNQHLLLAPLRTFKWAALHLWTVVRESGTEEGERRERAKRWRGEVRRSEPHTEPGWRRGGDRRYCNN